MALNVEAALLTKIIETEDIRTVIRSKIVASFFADEDNRDVWRYLTNTYNKHGRVPSLKLLKEQFPEFKPVDTDDDLVLLIDEVKERKLYADLQKSLKEIAECTRSDPKEGLAKIKEMAIILASAHSTGDDMDLTKCSDELRDEFEKLQSHEGTLGIPWPWQALNKATLGLHNGEFVAFYARPKSMKTWVVLYVAYWIHKNTGKIPLFFTKEMPPEQIRRRWVALYCVLEYGPFREGKLTEEEEIRFYDFLDKLENEDEQPFMVSTIESTGAAAITEVRAKIDDFQADFVIVDGLYFMAEDPSWKEFSVITRGLKQLAREKKIPIIGTTQANRSAERTKGQGLSEVAFGDSLAMDVDVLIRIIRDGQQRENNELLLTLPALRESGGCTFTINAYPATDFSQKHAFEMKEGHDEVGSTDDGAIV